MATLPTVRIVADDGFATINESDFNPAVHRRFDAKAPEAKKGGKPEVSDASAADTETAPTAAESKGAGAGKARK